MIEFTTEELLQPGTLGGLLRWAPEGGVLSIYVDADSRSDAGLQGAAIDIRNRLSELQRNIELEGPPDRLAELRRALRRLAPEIERLSSPRERGRGRVLFASLGGQEPSWFACQMPFANRVVLDANAFVHPLLELLDEGRPAGVVLASRDQARLLQWRLGELHDLQEMAREVFEPPHERPGPVGSMPTPRSQTPEREQRSARRHAETQRFLDQVGDAATAAARKHGWERVLLSGDDRLTEPLAQALSAGAGCAVIRDPRVLVALDRATLAQAVSERLGVEHAEHERRLLGEVCASALARGPAALGLSEVVGGLNESRVAHLIYDPEVRYRGAEGADGLLLAGEERADDGPVRPEPRLTERMLERALATGARVTPVEGAARAELAQSEGIAARLRW